MELAAIVTRNEGSPFVSNFFNYTNVSGRLFKRYLVLEITWI